MILQNISIDRFPPPIEFELVLQNTRTLYAYNTKSYYVLLHTKSVSALFVFVER